jgi:hypothetical protein
MKTLGIVLLSAATLGASSAYAGGTATATANANIVVAIAITNTAGLNFGQLVGGVTLGTCVIPAVASPTRSVTGGVVLGNVTTTSSGAFNVTGLASATYAISLPASAVITDGTNNMTVNTFTSLPATTGALSAGGTQTLYVGATLNVAASQVFINGTPFTGTFPVTVAYN